jgi:hypothetical protein
MVLLYFPPLLNWGRASSLSRLHDQTHLDTPHSVGLLWTSDQPVEETSIHKRQTSMFPAGFENLIITNERPETHVLGRVATGID